MTTKLIRELRDAVYNREIDGEQYPRESMVELIAQADAYLREQERGEECPNCISPWKCNGPHIGRQPDFYTADHMDEAPAASAPADANAAPMDDMNDIVLRELAKEEAPADAPVAWYRNGPRGFVFSADLELESVWPRRSEGWIPLYATPPAPASGAVSDEDIEASARAIYATANKNYIGWPAAVQFADDALRTFASRHASQPAGAVSVPDGWKLVPIECTEEMRGAGNEGAAPYMVDAKKLWREMLAIAPSPPQHDKG